MSGTLTMTIGYPRSGKSTLVESIRKATGALVVEPDWIRTNILGHQFHRPAEPIIWLIADSFIRIALSQGHTVILDGTNLMPYVREKYITLAKEMSADVKCVWVNTPMEECVRRNNVSPEGQKLPHYALVSKEDGFVPPSEEEGFNEVIVVDYKENE